MLVLMFWEMERFSVRGKVDGEGNSAFRSLDILRGIYDILEFPL
jgi:hypothetical protein